MAVCELWTADIRATVAGMVQPPLPEGTLMEMLCPISCQSSSCNPEPEPEDSVRLTTFTDSSLSLASMAVPAAVLGAATTQLSGAGSTL